MTLKQLVEKLKLQYPKWDCYDDNREDTEELHSDMEYFNHIIGNKEIEVFAIEDAVALGDYIAGRLDVNMYGECPAEAAIYNDGIWVYVGNV